MADRPVLTTAWRKSSYSGSGNNCVEVAGTGAGVSVRDSKNPSGSVLVFSTDEWRTFAARVSAGEFDLV